ncbi:MAG: hypothetical protein A3F42_08165 [Gammaproteobacteria bacterium RIFCSPHIGHO2_12_FULL_37_34]|nr:MAG: hypothetical protein A3F42_08165 [Gammaproteobacteria bacterium RIFCSPHIGHO2_12_FULL_37_34]
METVLIDTDIAIDFLRGLLETKNLILPLWENNIAFLSILSVYELYAGMHPKEQEITNHFIHACKIETLSLEITRHGAEIYQHYRKQGLTLTSIDCLIWATAKVKKHKIATRNFKHYPDKNILLTHLMR